MADEEKAKQSLSGVRFGTKHSYDDFGLVLQKKDLSLPEPKTEKIEVTGRNGGTVMLGWIVAGLVNMTGLSIAFLYQDTLKCGMLRPTLQMYLKSGQQSNF